MVGRADQHDIEILLLQHLAIIGEGARLLLRCLPRRDHVGRLARASALSTSQSDTTSTGATWIRRNRSALPYQPVPIRPTRRFFSLSNSCANAGASAKSCRACRQKLSAIHGGMPPAKYMRFDTRSRSICDSTADCRNRLALSHVGFSDGRIRSAARDAGVNVDVGARVHAAGHADRALIELHGLSGSGAVRVVVSRVGIP